MFPPSALHRGMPSPSGNGGEKERKQKREQKSESTDISNPIGDAKEGYLQDPHVVGSRALLGEKSQTSYKRMESFLTPSRSQGARAGRTVL